MGLFMKLFIGIGALSFIFGLLFIVAPAVLKTLNEWTSRVAVNMEEKAFTHRFGVGISMMIASLLFFFVAYYIKIKG
jgi:hypothetical protein